MNTNRIRYNTRTATRTGALAILAAGLLLGTPAIASADPSTTPMPPPRIVEPQRVDPGYPKPVIADPIVGTLTTGTYGSSGGQLLTVHGEHWQPNKAIMVDVKDLDGNVLLHQNAPLTNQDGVFDMTTNCATGPRFSTNATLAASYQFGPGSTSVDVIVFTPKAVRPPFVNPGDPGTTC